MSQFSSQGSQLMVGGLPLAQLAERVGQTPFYAYDRKLIKQRVAELRAALPASIKLHYAMKANPMPAGRLWRAGRWHRRCLGWRIEGRARCRHRSA
jgi:diaminopimelate decarboxylase